MAPNPRDATQEVYRASGNLSPLSPFTCNYNKGQAPLWRTFQQFTVPKDTPAVGVVPDNCVSFYHGKDDFIRSAEGTLADKVPGLRASLCAPLNVDPNITVGWQDLQDTVKRIQDYCNARRPDDDNGPDGFVGGQNEVERYSQWTQAPVYVSVDVKS